MEPSNDPQNKDRLKTAGLSVWNSDVSTDVRDMRDRVPRYFFGPMRSQSSRPMMGRTMITTIQSTFLPVDALL